MKPTPFDRWVLRMYHWGIRDPVELAAMLSPPVMHRSLIEKCIRAGTGILVRIKPLRITQRNRQP